MMDDPEQFESLLARLHAALPPQAAPTPELAAIMREQAPRIAVPMPIPATIRGTKSRNCSTISLVGAAGLEPATR